MTIQVVIDSNLGTERLSKMIVLIFIVNLYNLFSDDL